MSGGRRCQRWAAAVVSLVAVAAPALDIGGAASVGYTRNDGWIDGQLARADYLLNWSANLKLSGELLWSSVGLWNANVGYNAARDYFVDRVAPGDAISYELGASILPRGALSATVWAARGWGWSGTTLGDSSRGVALTSAEGVAARAYLPGLPRLTAQVTHQDQTNYYLAGDPLNSQRLDAAVRLDQTTTQYQYHGKYAERWSYGSIATLNSQSREFGLSAAATPAQKVQFFGGYSFLERIPTVEAATNPRLSTTNFNVGGRWQVKPSLGSSTTYTYGRSLFAAPGTPTMEVLRNSLSETLSSSLSSSVQAFGSVSLGLSSNRLDTDSVSAADQSAGLGLTWSRALGASTGFSCSLGGSAGISESGDAPVKPIYGANANLGAWSHLGRLSYGGTYAGAFQEAGLERSLSHRLTLDSTWTFSPTTGLKFGLYGTYARRWLTLLGYSSNREAGAILSFHVPTVTLRAQASYQDSTTPLLSSDDAFVPTSLNHQSHYIEGSVSWQPRAIGLGAQAAVRTSASRSPDGLAYNETAFSVGLSYQLGAFVLSLTEQYATGSGGGASSQVSRNIIMARLTRSFGWSI